MHSYEECLKHFNVKEKTGLTEGQVKDFQAKYGPNGGLISAMCCYLNND